jgi:putative ABC transport system permease protein
MMQQRSIDGAFLPMYGIPVLYGRNLDDNRSDDVYSREEAEADRQIRTEAEENDTEPVYNNAVNILINEKAIGALGLSGPEAAIGSTHEVNDRPVTIVGIVPNINLGMPDEELRPTYFMNNEARKAALNIRYASPGAVDLEAVEAAWKAIVPTAPATTNALSIAREVALRPLHQMRAGFLAIAAVAIILAGTGLYALAAFLAASRKKEMGIRKVHGARTGQLVRRMLLQFSKPVVLALIIGLPVGHWGMQSYLELYPDRIGIDIAMLMAAGILTLVIAWMTVIVHAVKTAHTHPAEVLRYE